MYVHRVGLTLIAPKGVMSPVVTSFAPRMRGFFLPMVGCLEIFNVVISGG